MNRGWKEHERDKLDKLEKTLWKNGGVSMKMPSTKWMPFLWPEVRFKGSYVSMILKCKNTCVLACCWGTVICHEKLDYFIMQTHSLFDTECPIFIKLKSEWGFYSEFHGFRPRKGDFKQI